jgi:O-antigen/teichoic acid export membrane protein
LMLVEVTPQLFFGFQLCVAVAELAILMLYAYRLLPQVSKTERSPWSFTPLRAILKFSFTIAFTSSVWVLVTQTDKLVLSKILPLTEYGYFTVAVLLASGILMICSPISNAILPRMSTLEARGDHAGVIRIYRKTTQLVAILAGSTSVTVALFAAPLLWVWTGDRHLADEAAPILRLYALGNGILAVAAFPYYLQYAKGDLRLHLIGNAGFVILLVPIIAWAASQYGALGAGYVWLGMNLLSFIGWLPFVHRKFVPGLNARWYREDVLIIVAAALAAAFALSVLLPSSDGRWTQLAAVIVTGTVAVLAGAAASSEIRARLSAFLFAAPQR